MRNFYFTSIIRKSTSFLLMFSLACSSSNESEEFENEIDPIIGSWEIIERGGAFDDGEKFRDEMPCSNAQRLHFYEDNLFDLEIWWGTGSGCEFDQVQNGEWLKTTRSDHPASNYRLIYYEIAGYVEGETGYPVITFDRNTMRIQYNDDNNTNDLFDYTYRTYVRQ